ncbi:protein translocase subunit SecD [Candidatus Uhrbacteria bacterium]|nr:protein translocase subunit SecD [Candidatus Uhrbacteria bacterium]
MGYSYRKYLDAKHRSQASRSSGSGRSWLWAKISVLVVLVLLALGFAVPQAFQAIGLPGLSTESYRLGLDLKGGTHLEYGADMSDIPSSERDEALEGVRDVIERRVNAFGVSEPVVQTITSGGGYRVVVDLAGVLDVSEAIREIGETPILEFKEPGANQEGLTPEQKTELETKQAEERKAAKDLLAKARREGFGDTQTETLTNIAPAHPLYGPLVSAIVTNKIRVGGYTSEENAEGINVLRLDSVGEDTEWDLSHILICFEGKTNCPNPIPAIEASIQVQKATDGIMAENFADRAREFSTDPSAKENGGELSWTQPGFLPPAAELAVRSLPVGSVSSAVETEYGYHVFLKRAEKPVKTYTMTRNVSKLTQPWDVAPDAGAWVNTPLSGKQLERAGVEFDQSTGQPYVALQFDAEGDKLFGEITARRIKQQIAIFLDGEVISAPVVQQAIYGGRAVISGTFTVEEAKLLAQRLNAGALPVPVELLSQRTVGPTLGADSLDRSLKAGLIGFFLVALFMVLYYRLSGVIAIIALTIYALLNLAAYKIFGVTLTLSGIAGFILSLGMAVDANVLIFERTKEELRDGRDLHMAMIEGFKRAWTSIRDGNATSLITAAVLFLFSTSFIKGFAVTLSIGILLSMFTTITVSRLLLLVVSKFAKRSWWYGVSQKASV